MPPPASFVVVLGDAQPAAWLALASYAVVLADARPGSAGTLRVFSAQLHRWPDYCPLLSMLLLLGLVALLGRGTLSLPHSLFFAFALEDTQAARA